MVIVIVDDDARWFVGWWSVIYLDGCVIDDHGWCLLVGVCFWLVRVRVRSDDDNGW